MSRFVAISPDYASPSLAESVDFPAAILPHIMCRVAFEAAIGRSLKSRRAVSEKRVGKYLASGPAPLHDEDSGRSDLARNSSGRHCHIRENYSPPASTRLYLAIQESMA